MTDLLDHTTLSLIWFLLLAVLLAGYAILDGFDLGVGIMHLIIPSTEHEKRLSMNSIGPLWDGNEVWLITFGGAMFAMFPEAYKTIFSGFYVALFLLLFALISRAVSMEFRSKMGGAGWRRFWDAAFCVSSTAATLLFGVAVGNCIIGIPLNDAYDYTGSFFGLLRPYALAVGLLAVALFAMHGTLYLYLKTEGEFQQRVGTWMWRTFFLFLVLFIIVTGWTLAIHQDAITNLQNYPILWVVPVLNVLAIANIPRAIHKKKAAYAFISSACSIAAFVFLFCVALFPNLVVATDPANSLNLFNAASSQTTLSIGLLVVIIGLPFVLSYTVAIYWTFRGKVQLGEHSY